MFPRKTKFYYYLFILFYFFFRIRIKPKLFLIILPQRTANMQQQCYYTNKQTNGTSACRVVKIVLLMTHSFQNFLEYGVFLENES